MSTVAHNFIDLNGLKYYHNQLKANFLKDYKGATASADGEAGFVPAALIADRNKFLKGDGTWAEITLPSTLTASNVQTGTDTAGKLISAKVLHDYVESSNTDTKVNVTLGTTTKAYLLGTSTTPSSTAAGVTAISDTGVYLDTTAGRLTAASFAGNVENGTLATANAVVVTNANKKLTASTTITTTELGYLDGVTSSIQTQLDGKAASSHNQASNTINAMTGYSKPSSTSAIGTSDTLNSAIGKLEKALDGKQTSGSYAAASHNHDASNINSGTLDAARIPGLDASKIASGTIDIARLPAGALPILKVVGNETERFALTSSDVQVGDTVQQTDTGLMYYVKDVSKLNSADGYAVYTAGAATSVPWSGITNKPSTYAPSSHNQASNTINAMTGYSKPSSTSAIGTSDTLNTAIGKLEKALDGKQASGSYAAASHNHASSEVTAMTSYAKPSSTSAIAATDSLNAAIGKLEKALDGKQASGSYAAASHNQASSTINAMTGYSKPSSTSAIGTSDTLNAAIGKLEKALDGKQASGSYLTSSSTLDATKLSGTIPSTCYTNTTYSNFVKSGSTAAAGLVPSPGTTAGTTKFLCEDASWKVPYTHPTTSGNKHIPSGGSSGKFLGWSADGTAAWVANPNTHKTTHLYAGASGATANAATTTNTTTFLTVVDDTTASNSIQITGSGGTSVTAAEGVITIDTPSLSAISNAEIDAMFA